MGLIFGGNMKTKICQNCQKEFPLNFYDNKGKRITLYSRKFCLECSPFKEKINPENLNHTELDKTQEQILYGHLLGDGHLSKRKPYKYPSFQLERSMKDIEYLKWTFSYFSDLVSKNNIEKETKNQIYHSVRFRTRSLMLFNNYYDKWYPEGKKIVPKDLELTPLTIAVWLADDGCVHSRKRYKNSGNSFEITFCTHGFDFDSAEFLHSQLVKKYGDCIYLRETKNKQPYINISKKSVALDLLTDIDPFFPHLQRKRKIWEKEIETEYR